MNPITPAKISDKTLASCKDCSFTSFCSPQTLSNIAKQKYKINRRHQVCTTQQTFKSLYVVKSGVLKASVLEIEGRERIVGFYLPGEVLGLEAIYNHVYPFAVEALSEAVICEVSFESLLIKISMQPALQRQLLRMSSRQINIGSYVSFVRAEQRVAGFLLELAERLHCNNPMQEFTLPMSRQAIGDYLGLASETIIRIINRFHQQEILLVNKKRIQLYDLPKLHWLMQGGLLESFSH